MYYIVLHGFHFFMLNLRVALNAKLPFTEAKSFSSPVLQLEVSALSQDES